MPKIVDTEERQRLVAEAAWRVLVRDGATELSVRKVAAEAGLAPSSLRHSFPTQASVRNHAVALLVERLTTRVERASDAATGAALAHAILLELLPLDDERRMEMEVSLSFGALAMTDDALRAAYSEIDQAVRSVCAQALALLGADPAELGSMHALIDGLALHLVRQSPGAPADWALTALDDQLGRLRPAGA